MGGPEQSPDREIRRGERRCAGGRREFGRLRPRSGNRNSDKERQPAKAKQMTEYGLRHVGRIHEAVPFVIRRLAAGSPLGSLYAARRGISPVRRSLFQSL